MQYLRPTRSTTASNILGLFSAPRRGCPWRRGELQQIPLFEEIGNASECYRPRSRQSSTRASNFVRNVPQNVPRRGCWCTKSAGLRVRAGGERVAVINSTPQSLGANIFTRALTWCCQKFWLFVVWQCESSDRQLRRQL